MLKEVLLSDVHMKKNFSIHYKLKQLQDAVENVSEARICPITNKKHVH